MQTPLSDTAKRTLLAGGLMLALIVAGFFGLRHWRNPIPAEEVASYLDKVMGAGKVRFSDVRVEATRLENGDLRLAAYATARTLRPLFSKVDAAAYLRGTFNLDPESTAKARQFIADNDTSQGQEYSRLRPFPPDPYRSVILRMTTPAGASYAYQAVLAARRDGDGWSLALESGAFDSGYPVGEARSAYGDGTFLAGDPRDDARLGALAADLQAFAGRLAETQRNLEAAHDARVRIRQEVFFARMAPGSIYQGVATRADEQMGTALYLELTGLSSGNRVTALLRNAGGWHYARAFQGTWSADGDFKSPTLSLSSPTDQAIRNAGPFLENTQAWAFELRMDPAKGSLSEENRFYRYQFQFVDAGQAALLRAGLSDEFVGAASATAPGSLYQGAAVSKASGASETILLRFTGRSGDGESLQASIESTTRMWRRPLHGAIIGNSRRSGGRPVRLRSGSSEAVGEAPADSVLGDRDGLEIHLGAEHGSLYGDDERFTYRLAAAAGGDLGTLDAARAAGAARFARAIRGGIAYDGVIRDDQGSVTEARLEIAKTVLHVVQLLQPSLVLGHRLAELRSLFLRFRQADPEIL